MSRLLAKELLLVELSIGISGLDSGAVLTSRNSGEAEVKSPGLKAKLYSTTRTISGADRDWRRLKQRRNLGSGLCICCKVTSAQAQTFGFSFDLSFNFLFSGLSQTLNLRLGKSGSYHFLPV
jgi:hypothetical protein